MNWPVSKWMPYLEAAAGEYGVSVSDMQGRSRLPFIVAARQSAAKRLRDAKMSRSQIAHILNRDITTIDAYVYPKRKTRKNAWNKARYAAIKEARASV